MPLRLEDIERDGVPIYFLKKGEVHVRVGPCSATAWNQKIPLDGRHYICSGKIIFKNGQAFRANFEINTHTFDFLERNTVRIYIEKEKAWYYIDEEELYQITQISREEAFPYRWISDQPLDYHEKGPYPMKWPED
jgi:hypothetical protein